MRKKKLRLTQRQMTKSSIQGLFIYVDFKTIPRYKALGDAVLKYTEFRKEYYAGVRECRNRNAKGEVRL